MNIDEIVGRLSRTTNKNLPGCVSSGDCWKQIIEKEGYFGIWPIDGRDESLVQHPAGGTQDPKYGPLGMMLLPGHWPYTLPEDGLDSWGEQRVDRTTPICAGSNMNCCNDCFTPKDGMREPSGYDPSWCACKVPDVDLAEPKQDKEVTVECAGIAGTEYSTSENTPAAARTLEKWTYDSTRRNWAEHAYNEFDGFGNPQWTAPGAYKSVMTFNAADQPVQETLTELIYTPASGQGTNGHDGGSWGAQGTQVTSEYDIKYDKHGNLWSDGRKVFNYDVLNRLTGVWAQGAGSPVAKGNPIAAYSYDGYGHRLTARYNTNNNAILDDDPIDVYSYDHLWRVRTVTRAVPSSSSASATWTSYIREQWFYHNSDDPSQYKQGSDAPVMRRINTTGNVDANGNSIFDTTQNFVTDRQGSVVAILGAATAVDPNNESLGGKPGPVVAYVRYDTYGTPIISDPADINRDGRVDAADAAAYIQYWQAYHANTANSYRYKEILDFDKDGSVATHSGDTATAPDPNNADFHALSARIVAAQVEVPVAEKLGNLPLYCGYWWDADLEMYHVRHRVYRPQWGKWIQRDPLGYLPGWNLYEYVGGEPWREFDPLGLLTFAEWGQVAGEAAKGAWNGLRGLGNGIGKAANQVYLIVKDLLHSGDLRYHYESELMKHFEYGDAAEMFANGFEQAGRFVLSAGTLGGYDIADGVDKWVENGDDEALGERMGGVVFNNLSIVLLDGAGRALKSAKGAAAESKAAAGSGGAGAGDAGSAGGGIGDYTSPEFSEPNVRVDGPEYSEPNVRIDGPDSQPRGGPLYEVDLTKPGPFSAESIPARNAGSSFTKAERAAIDSAGNTRGCHSCGNLNPGTKYGNWVLDHQPVSSLNVHELPQQLFPQCLTCSQLQGWGIMRAIQGHACE